MIDVETGASTLLALPRSMASPRAFALGANRYLLAPTQPRLPGADGGIARTLGGLLIFDGETFVPASHLNAEEPLSRASAAQRESFRTAALSRTINVPVVDPWRGTLIEPPQEPFRRAERLELRDGRYLAFGRIPSENREAEQLYRFIDGGDRQSEAIHWGARDWRGQCLICSASHAPMVLIYQAWLRGELAGSELERRLGPKPLPVGDWLDLDTDNWVPQTARHAPAPGARASPADATFCGFAARSRRGVRQRRFWQQ